jgi:hypothetical protein
MLVQELIIHLSRYAAASPENGHAKVLLRFDEELCVQIAGGEELKGLPGEHYLVLGPDFTGTRFKMKALKKM